MADHCVICQRPRKPPSEFCQLHSTAQRNLEAAYAAWSRATAGTQTRVDYYIRLEALPETGSAVKAVIQHLRTKEATR